MQIRDVMTPDVSYIIPSTTLKEAAEKMAAGDFGALPVGKDDRLVGMVTDRDIVVRGVGKGLDVEKTPVEKVMSNGIFYVFEDQDCEEAARTMREKQIRRLPVLNRDKRMTGIISLGDIATCSDTADEAEEALEGVSRENEKPRAA